MDRLLCISVGWYILYVSPVVPADNDNDGIPDSEDIDDNNEDGLTNLDEYSLGTDPFFANVANLDNKVIK